MTNLMEDKIKIIDEHIRLLDNAIEKNDSNAAKKLQTTIIAVYDNEIVGLTKYLDSYGPTCFSPHTVIDYIGDAELLREMLRNYKVNLITGLVRPLQETDGSITVTQQVNQDISTTITIDQAITNIQKLPESVLSDEDKDTLTGKISAILTENNKEKRWDKVCSALKWIAEKGIQVGIAALPYIAKALEASS